jgi:protocatechuate 3,4-dioxygenase beta subunit
LQAFNQHENLSTAIVAGADQNTENLLFRLTPAASISGQVTDEFSGGVRNAQVMLFRKGIMNGREAVQMQNQSSTDDKGQFNFAALEPGRYYVAVSAQPWYAQHNTLHFSDPSVDAM